MSHVSVQYSVSVFPEFVGDYAGEFLGPPPRKSFLINNMQFHIPLEQY